MAKELNFLTTQSEILNALVQSKQHTTTIALRADVLGADAVLGCVDDLIFEDGQTTIILKHYDASGYMLPVYKINLTEIQGVYPFSTPFLNPFLGNVGKDRSWYF